jgi:hypothetical protein
VDPARYRFRNAIDRVSFLAAHPNLDHPRLVLDDLAYRFPAESPLPREITDAVMLFEGRVLNGQGSHG